MINQFRLFLLLLCLYSFNSSAQTQYVGDKILRILGQVKDSSTIYKEFANDWGFGRKMSIPEKGIKLSKNSELNTITGITFANKGYEVNEIKFEKYSGTVPFGVSMDDNEKTLIEKLGTPSGKSGETFSKFKKDGLVINAVFKNSQKDKLVYLKITMGLSLTESTSTAIDASKTKQPSKEEPVKKKIEDSMNQPQKGTATKADNKAPDSTIADIPTKPLKKLLMEVFESGSETFYESIKGEKMQLPNFWNYKHTYTTTIKIPGERYNMLYSFPFEKSALDWVCVLEESSSFTPELEAKYHDFETKLKEAFPETSGWKYSYTQDQDPSWKLKDLEIKNSKIGSVVLDYHKNPAGKNVLYMRLLLFYD